MSLPAMAPFTSPEFYPEETPISVWTSDGERLVYRFGNALLRNVVDGRELIEPEDFRAEFPDGVIPEDGDWEFMNNGWFEETAFSLDVEDVSFDLSDFGFVSAT